MFKHLVIVAAVACISAQTPVLAAVTAEEAAQLKSSLTPLGAEKAGNGDGTIPAWTGGYVKPLQGASDGKHPDPFANEKPVVSITAQNLAQYTDKLSEGTVALLKSGRVSNT